MSRLLFLSHSGIDTEAARALKQRLLSAPAACEYDLSVWFDKDDLKAGQAWQSQLEDAIANSHAFAVYVGSKGVVNWVEAEVRLALNRAMSDPDYRLIPILAKDAPGPEALPSFAQQFQGVFDVENKAEQFEKLTRAIFDGIEAGQIQLESQPFFGLRAIDESRSHLFFGRETETDELVDLLSRTPLMLVTGDSGSGKSSLVRAGLVPRFRGGALALLEGARPEDVIWHVVTTRPGAHPFRKLGEAVDHAAKGLGLSLEDRGTLADWAASGEMEKVRRALRCDLPPDRVRVLVVVDQFEELLTVTPAELREPFIDALLDLADPAVRRHRVVLTMRNDYFNLCTAYNSLRERLEADDRRARFRLGRMGDDGLRTIITEPLRLAGIKAPDREILAQEVLRDVGERPGDLALVQMALTETWIACRQNDGDLLRAYAHIGRVEGALAQAAEHIRTHVLDDQQRKHLDYILLRLVRLGDTGGATRRVAMRDEFDKAHWSVIQTLASEDGKRLVLLRGGTEQPTAEIAHEALVTAWPHFQTLLQNAPEKKRILDALIPRVRAWIVETDEQSRNKRLATGADLELFAALFDQHEAWLSNDERLFVQASADAEAERQRREREMKEALRAERDKAAAAAKVAKEKEKIARANESRALAALSEVAANQHRHADAVKLALAAWPRNIDDDRPKLRATIEALAKAQRSQRQVLPSLKHDGHVSGAVFNGNETRILTWSDDHTVRLWDAATGEAVLPPLRHDESVWGAKFNGDETRILTHSHTARLWHVATGQEIIPALQHEGAVSGAVFNGDETRILTWSDDHTARLWDASTGEAVLPPLRHDNWAYGAKFNADETLILTWGWDNTTRLWDAATGKTILPPLRHDEPLGGSQFHVSGAIFNRDESLLLTWSQDGTARLWNLKKGDHVLTLRHRSVATFDAAITSAIFDGQESHILTSSADGTARLWAIATGQEVIPALQHERSVAGAVFNGDETRILTWSSDKTAQLWDAATGKAILPPLRHDGPVSDAVFNGDETRILTCSQDGTARLWDISRLPPGHLIDVACGMLPDHDTADLKDSYGVAITEPICGPNTPAPVWTELVD